MGRTKPPPKGNRPPPPAPQLGIQPRKSMGDNGRCVSKREDSDQDDGLIAAGIIAAVMGFFD